MQVKVSAELGAGESTRMASRELLLALYPCLTFYLLLPWAGAGKSHLSLMLLIRITSVTLGFSDPESYPYHLFLTGPIVIYKQIKELGLHHINWGGGHSPVYSSIYEFFSVALYKC